MGFIGNMNRISIIMEDIRFIVDELWFVVDETLPSSLLLLLEPC